MLGQIPLPLYERGFGWGNADVASMPPYHQRRPERMPPVKGQPWLDDLRFKPQVLRWRNTPAWLGPGPPRAVTEWALG